MYYERVKYVTIVKNGCKNVIVFSELLDHSTFQHLEPISAGFVRFDTTEDENGNTVIYPIIYGESVTLNLKPNQEVDSVLIMEQILQQDQSEW